MNDRHSVENPTGDVDDDWEAYDVYGLQEVSRAARRDALRASGRYLGQEMIRARENLQGGMRAEDIFGFCPPEELEGLEELRREFRALDLAREPKI